MVQLRLTGAGHAVVEQVLTSRRTELERLVAETAQWWGPEVIAALAAFAEAAGEMPEQEWWLAGLDPERPERATGLIGAPPASMTVPTAASFAAATRPAHTA